MDKNLALTLDTYFNDKLWSSLGYTDKYDIPVYISGERMIFFKRKSGSDDFGRILYDNPQLLVSVKNILLDLLNNYYDDIIEVKLKFDKQGFGIILISASLTTLNIDAYVNILKQFNTTEEIDNFCRSTKELKQVCKSKELWRGLFKSIYDFPYKYEYNYEQLYKQYLIYKSSMWQGIQNLLTFLFKEDVVKSEEYGAYLLPSIYSGNKEVFDIILRNYMDKNLSLVKITNLLINEDILGNIFFNEDHNLLLNIVDMTNGIIYKGVNIGHYIIQKVVDFMDVAGGSDDKNLEYMMKNIYSNKNFGRVFNHMISSLPPDYGAELLQETIEDMILSFI